ncbi:MAG TPA: DUF370 domain-containing protein [Bacillota bacterium]|nr:DUF370 domain-containing protein [Bacillota bacterium]
MTVRMVGIGFGNMIAAQRVVALVSPESAPIKRIVQEARAQGELVDATYGRRTRAVIVTDTDLVILSAVHPDTLAVRLAGDHPPSTSPGGGKGPR